MGSAGPEVILVHGLWMNRWAMWPLAWRLRRAGFRVGYHGYFSALCSHERNIEGLVRRLKQYSSTNVPHVVAHSLGGVLALQALLQSPDLTRTKTRVLALGSPLRGSDAGRQFMCHAFGRFCVGTSGSLWQTFPVLHVPPALELGVIAGTRRLGLGRFFARLIGANDGVVTVAETRLDGLADHLVLSVSHTGMLVSKQVADQCVAFLRDGRFKR